MDSATAFGAFPLGSLNAICCAPDDEMPPALPKWTARAEGAPAWKMGYDIYSDMRFYLRACAEASANVR